MMASVNTAPRLATQTDQASKWSSRRRAMSARRRVLSIIGGSVGNLVEWYDWFVYAAFSLYFARVFFPAGSQSVQLLNTAAVFAVGFLMRPVGGWMMGWYA